MPAHLVIFSLRYKHEPSYETLTFEAKLAEAMSALGIKYSVVDLHHHDRDGDVSVLPGFCVFLPQNPGSIVFQDEEAALYDLLEKNDVTSRLVVTPERSTHLDITTPTGRVIVPGAHADFSETQPANAAHYVKFAANVYLVLDDVAERGLRNK